MLPLKTLEEQLLEQSEPFDDVFFSDALSREISVQTMVQIVDADLFIKNALNNMHFTAEHELNYILLMGATGEELSNFLTVYDFEEPLKTFGIEEIKG